MQPRGGSHCPENRTYFSLFLSGCAASILCLQKLMGKGGNERERPALALTWKTSTKALLVCLQTNKATVTPQAKPFLSVERSGVMVDS